ncbi:MAG: hypothetical protein H0X65_06325 [Gemmatimonadetes bacterium]|nr:hypothetical protein [Gemmatimonadota bacterium]
MRLSFRSIIILLPLALGITACGDPAFGRTDPQIAHDTVSIQAPSDQQPQASSALDVTAQIGLIGGARDPERLANAPAPGELQGRWDLVVRRQDGQLVFLPAGAVLGTRSRAGISQPLAGQTFEELREVPAGTVFVTDSAVAVQPGQLYVVRSREFRGGFGNCLQYAKLRPVQADAATGSVQVEVATNEVCFDTRLVEPGS